MTRRRILETILSELNCAWQWGGRSKVNVSCQQRSLEYLVRASALIELMEVADHGSVGAFAPGQSYTGCLFERWVWLVRCNPEDEDLLKDTMELRKYFTKDRQ